VAEFIQYAKRNPGKINYGSSGPGSGIQFAGELFNTLAGVDVVHVPYKGIGPAMQDVIAGRCQVTFDPSAKPYVDSGRVRLLGITSARRDPRFPNAPTLAEAGLAGYDLTYWLAMFGPAGLPAGVQARLNSVVNQALTDPDLRTRLAVLGITATGGSADTLRARVAAERKYLQRIANDAKLRFD
jgi:tripartite-type tricarboxylate transporter receptor subunit TctC